VSLPGALNNTRNHRARREPWPAVAFGQLPGAPDVLAAYASSALCSTRCANFS
jgi:hypothetical protein